MAQLISSCPKLLGEINPKFGLKDVVDVDDDDDDDGGGGGDDGWSHSQPDIQIAFGIFIHYGVLFKDVG